MSLYDYLESRDIEACGFSFYALIMAAMRQADSDNIQKLEAAFPKIHNELRRRYHAPGGILEEERPQNDDL